MKIEKLSQLPKEDLFLYRYVTIDKLIDFLLNKRIPLTRLNLFEDKLEGVTLQHLLLNLTSDKLAEDTVNWFARALENLVLNINTKSRNSLRRQRIDFQKNNYASCWFTNDHESVAMWRLYSSPDSIAIKIPVKALIEQLESNAFSLTGAGHEKIRYGSVMYCRFDDVDSLSQILDHENKQGFIKDKSFSHETEFRIVLSVKGLERKKVVKRSMILDEQIDDFNRKTEIKIIYLLLNNFTSLPFELIFHPLASDWHKENVTETVKKFDINFPLKESKLKRIFF